MSDVNDQSTEISKNWLPSVEVVSGLNTSFSDLKIQEYKFIGATSPEVADIAIRNMTDLKKSMQEDLKKYEGLISSPDEKNLYKNFQTEYDDFIKTHDQIIDLVNAGSKEEATNLLHTKSLDKFSAAGEYLDKLIALNYQGA